MFGFEDYVFKNKNITPFCRKQILEAYNMVKSVMMIWRVVERISIKIFVCHPDEIGN